MVVPVLVKPVEILLVEDNRGDVRPTREALKEGKVINHLTVFKDDVEGLVYLRRQGPYAKAACPHHIVLDLNLPKKDGREVLAEIKADNKVEAHPCGDPDELSGGHDLRYLQMANSQSPSW